MKGRKVNFLERNSVEGHGVFAVCETPEKSLALTESDPIGIEAKGARREVHVLCIVSQRRHEIPDEFAADFSFGGNRLEGVAGGSGRRSHRYGFVHGNGAGQRFDRHRNRDVQSRTGTDFSARTSGHGETWRRNHNGVSPDREILNAELSVIVSYSGARG